LLVLLGLGGSLLGGQLGGPAVLVEAAAIHEARGDAECRPKLFVLFGHSGCLRVGIFVDGAAELVGFGEGSLAAFLIHEHLPVGAHLLRDLLFLVALIGQHFFQFETFHLSIKIEHLT
jgi:hypothetical protein